MTTTHWSYFWTVDAVIECITGVSGELERELLKVAPNAYGVESDPDIDYSDDPGGDGIRLADVWDKLTPATREALDALYAAEYGD